MTITKTSSLILLAGIGLMGTTTASAASVVGSLDTDLSATFVDDTSSTTPLDPTDPTKPVDPGRPETGGSLSLDVAPMTIDFGTTTLIAGKNQTIFAKPMVVQDDTDTDKEVPHYVQVTDKRGGRLGWRLTVKQDAQLKSGTSELTGAIMSLQDSAILSPSEDEVAPQGFMGVLALTPGNEVPVMTATSGQGYLTWIQKYGSVTDDGSGKNENKGILLTVPAGAAHAATYTGSLTWALSDAPA